MLSNQSRALPDMVQPGERERVWDRLLDRTVDLAEGNHSVLVEFNARNFHRPDDGTRLFLRDLAIVREDEVVNGSPEAWSSGEMNLGGMMVD